MVVILIYHFIADQFSLVNICFDRGYESVIVQDESQREGIKKILSQSYTYLARGRQSYVFISADRQHVLKFFDASKLRSSSFPFPSGKRLKQKYNRLFEGYEVAYLRDRENTGLEFVQLGLDPSLAMEARVIDRFGFKQGIPLKRVPFIIQRAAIPTHEVLSKLLDRGEIERVKFLLRQVVDMYVDEYRKGLRDKDLNFLHNTGFMGNIPLRIDAGRLQFNEHFKSPGVYMRNLKRVVIGRSRKWLGRHYPKYKQEILADLQEKLQCVAH
jgi:hypothetical protein